MSMKVDEIQKDLQNNEDLVDNNKQTACQYNMALIKGYITNSKITCIALVIIWVCFIISYVITVLFSKGSQFGIKAISTDVLLKMGGNVPILVYDFGQVYRLVAAMFLHAGILHIIMNTASMIAFCAPLQTQVSTKLYLTAYIIGGIQGNLWSDFFHVKLANSYVVSIGASTSICAIMGLYFAVLYINSKKNINVQYNKKQFLSMIISLLVISVFPGVDFFGHFGSLISGFLIGMMGLIKFAEVELRRQLIAAIISIVIYSTVPLIPFF